jgi:hypothetical protein
MDYNSGISEGWKIIFHQALAPLGGMTSIYD